MLNKSTIKIPRSEAGKYSKHSQTSPVREQKHKQQKMLIKNVQPSLSDVNTTTSETRALQQKQRLQFDTDLLIPSHPDC